MGTTHFKSNIVAQGKKLASIHYFCGWILEKAPYKDYTEPDSVDVSDEVYNNYINYDGDEEVPY